MDCSPQAPLSMGFPRQEYQSGLSLPPPGDLPDPRIEPSSLMSSALAGGFFTTEPLGRLQRAHIGLNCIQNGDPGVLPTSAQEMRDVLRDVL